MMAKRGSQADLVEKVSALAASGGAALGAKTVVETASATAGLVAGVAGAVAAVHAAWSNWQDARIQRFLEEAFFENASNEGFGSYVAVILEDTRARRVLLEGVRAALESTADEVLPALAALMREYQRTGTPPDSRFRGLCRVLQDLSVEQYRTLRSLLHAGSAQDFLGGDLVTFEGLRSADRKREWVEVTSTARLEDGRWVSKRQTAIDGSDPRCLRHLFHLLDLHGIGWENELNPGRDDGANVRDSIDLRPDEVRWFVQFMSK